MEDIDYSVEICDQDWDCFLNECEDCNMLSPALAGVESGMSDFDETTSIFANVVHRTTDFPEEDRTIDGPPECDSSPVINYPNRRRCGGMESILSGSEEDIHLQCVNEFLERLKSYAEVEEFTEPTIQGQPWSEKTKNAAQEGGCCAGWKPEGNLRFNSVSAKNERNVGEAIGPLIKGHNGKKTVPRDESHSSPAPTVPDLNLLLQHNQSACPRVRLIISEEACTQNKLKEAARSTQPCHSSNHVDAESQISLNKSSMNCDVAEQDSESSPLEGYVCTCCSKQDVMMCERANDDPSVMELAGAKSIKSANRDLSPPAAVKRNRRRRRRLGEVGDSVHSCGRHDLVKSSDSEEEQCVFFTNELKKPAHWSASANVAAVHGSGKVSVKDNGSDDLSCQILQRGICKVTPECRNCTTNGRTHTSENSDNLTALSENLCRLQVEQSSSLDKSPALHAIKSPSICTDLEQPFNEEEGLDARSPLKDQSWEAMEHNHFSVPEVSANFPADPSSANPDRSPTCFVLEDSQLRANLAVESQPSEYPHNDISGQNEEHPEMLSAWPKSKSQSEVAAELRPSSDLRAVSSCCTADTRSLASWSNESITETSDCSCAHISQTSQTDETLIKNHKEVNGQQSLSASNDSAGDVALTGDDSAAAVKAEIVPELVPDSKNSVFVMSSFWSEMEKLTINDILGLRTISSVASDRLLAPIQGNVPLDGLDWSDSGFFTQPDEPTPPDRAHEGRCSFQNSMENPSHDDPTLTGDIVLTPTDSSQPVASAAVQTGIRKMAKNGSVHNLPALEAWGNYTWKRESLPMHIEEDSEDLDNVTDAGVSKESEEGDLSAQHTFSMSLGGIFNFIFGRRFSHPSPSAGDDSSPSSSYGSSVPETYHHFFSEFDTENFFCPFVGTKEQAKDELRPVFSCSTSARRNMQYPEVYECFFASSSSDESCTESDEEENRSPIRVVSRFNRTSSSSRFQTDVYDCFFTDEDLKRNLFWKNSFSFRNTSLNASTPKQQKASDSVASVQPGVRPDQRTLHPLSSLRNQKASFLDSAVEPFGVRFFRQLPQQQLDFENVHMNPNPSKLDLDSLTIVLSILYLSFITN